MARHLLAKQSHSDFVAEPSEMGFFARIRIICVCERNQPRDAACRYRTDPFTAAFAGLAFCDDRAGWCNRSGRITCRTFAGRSGLVSGDVCNRENADGDNIAQGRDPNQQKPHFELDGVRAPAAG
jgi:hypothetical protein